MEKLPRAADDDAAAAAVAVTVAAAVKAPCRSRTVERDGARGGACMEGGEGEGEGDTIVKPLPLPTDGSWGEAEVETLLGE